MFFSYLFGLIGCVFWAIVCYNAAQSRGRDAALGAVLGLIFGLFAYLGYLIAGKK